MCEASSLTNIDSLVGFVPKPPSWSGRVYQGTHRLACYNLHMFSLFLTPNITFSSSCLICISPLKEISSYEFCVFEIIYYKIVWIASMLGRPSFQPFTHVDQYGKDTICSGCKIDAISQLLCFPYLFIHGNNSNTNSSDSLERTTQRISRRYSHVIASDKLFQSARPQVFFLLKDSLFLHQEISVLSQCRSPYITDYYGSYLHQTKLWIVMEYMAGGSVADLVSSHIFCCFLCIYLLNKFKAQ